MILEKDHKLKELKDKHERAMFLDAHQDLNDFAEWRYRL